MFAGRACQQLTPKLSSQALAPPTAQNDRLRRDLRRDLEKDGSQDQVRTAEILKFRVSAHVNIVMVSAFEIS